MHRGRLGAGAGALVAVLAACAGGDVTGISLVAGESADRPQARAYAFTGDDIGTDSPTLTLRAGVEVAVTVENVHGRSFDGSESHDFAVVVDKDAQRSEWQYLWDARTPVLAPGESASVTFTPVEPGTYHYVCTIPGHARRGMWGEVVVTG